MKRERFFVVTGEHVRGPYDRHQVRIAARADPKARTFTAPAPALPKVAGLWLAFHQDTPEAEARRRFRERYGHDPLRVVSGPGLLLAGSIGGDQAPAA